MIEALGEKIKDNMDLISKDSQIQGVLRYKKYLRVEGRIDGDLIALEPGEGSVLFIGPNGIVNGNIYGCEVIVEGTVRGEIQARHLLEIRSSGMVIGDIQAKNLNIHHGGILQGRSVQPPQRGSSREAQEARYIFEPSPVPTT